MKMMFLARTLLKRWFFKGSLVKGMFLFRTRRSISNHVRLKRFNLQRLTENVLYMVLNSIKQGSAVVTMSKRALMQL